MAVNDKQAVDNCIEKGDIAKLLNLPEALDDFSEASIVRSVEYFLKSSEKKFELAMKQFSEEEISGCLPWVKEQQQAPFSDKKCYALNVMLGQKFSPQFLQEDVRTMPFDCVLNLIEYLHFLLPWIPTVPDPDLRVPSLEQIVDWLNALIDGHFQQLKLAEDATSIMESLQKQVAAMTSWQLESKVLQGSLSELNRQFEKQQKNTKIGDYCIEVISF